MFLVDISPSMRKVRTVDLPGEDRSIEMTNLEWALQFVKLKIQEMVRTTTLTILISKAHVRGRFSTDARQTNVV